MSDVRQFTSVSEMRAHYREVHKRMFPPVPRPRICEAPPPKTPPPLPPPPDAPFKPFAPIQSIGAIVAQFYGMKWRDLTGDCRHAEFVRPRHIAIYLAITMTGSSLPAIGRIFGGRDHTTLLSARNKIAKLVENNPLVRGEIELLKDLIRKRIAEIGNDPRQYLYRRAKWSRQS